MFNIEQKTCEWLKFESAEYKIFKTIYYFNKKIENLK